MLALAFKSFGKNDIQNQGQKPKAWCPLGNLKRLKALK